MLFGAETHLWKGPFAHTAPKSLRGQSERALRKFAPAACDEPLPCFDGDVGDYVGIVWRAPDGRVFGWPMRLGWDSWRQMQTDVKKGQVKRAFIQPLDSSIGAQNAWNDLWTLTPFLGTYTGSAKTARALTDADVGAIYVGGNAGASKTKHLLNLYWSSPGSTSSIYMLYDRVLTYEACPFGTSTQTMTNGVGAPRYSTGMLRLFCTQQTATGATASNWGIIHYTNTAGGASSITPSTTEAVMPVSQSAPGTGTTAVVQFPSGWGPFFAMGAGDIGVRSVTDYVMSGANTGTLCFVLAHPFILFHANTNGALHLDLFKGVMAPDRVLDGCCLAVLQYSLINATDGVPHGVLEMAEG